MAFLATRAGWPRQAPLSPGALSLHLLCELQCLTFHVSAEHRARGVDALEELPQPAPPLPVRTCLAVAAWSTCERLAPAGPLTFSLPIT